MHNIDRTTLESGYGEYESDEYGYEFEADGYGGEFEDEFGYEYEDEGGYYGETYGGSPFNEAEEMELAADLLNVTTEQELDQFLGKMFRKIGRAGRRFIRSPIGRHLGGIIKGAVKTALPIAGSALGNVLLPGVGGMVGGKLASAAGSMFGLELEGLSQEDQEFEVARQLVRFGGAAATNASALPPNVPPQQAAQKAAASAAQQFAPGLLSSNAIPAKLARGRCRHKAMGRWIRRGNNIVLIGA